MSPHRRYRRYDARRYILQLKCRLGRRGTVLACLGVLWVCTGIATLTAPGSEDYPLLTDVGPWEDIRGAVWIATGCIAIVCAGRRQGDDWPGWVALYVMVAYRLLAYLHGYGLWLLSDGGTSRGIIGALAWATALVPIAVCAGWEEPPTRTDGDTHDH